jgi:hypothetical protein
MCTVAPDGIAAPLVPLIASVVVAVMLSPTALVFVQTFDDDARAIVVPEAIVPVRAEAGAGAGAVLVGAGVVFFGVVVVFVGAFVTAGGFVGAFVVELVAVSLSVRLALSRFAIAMFAASAESFLSAVESVFDESPAQAASVSEAIARDAAVIRV